MKKFFTLICALVGFAGAANAATVDDITVCKSSYVLVFDNWDGNGTAKPGKGNLFGDGFFLDVTGGSVATNKQSIDLSDETYADGAYSKYAAYGKHLNSWRLKNGQDVIAMKVTAKSKIIILGQTHSSRYPMITDEAPASNTMQGNDLGSTVNEVSSNGRFEWVADDDRTIYIGSKGGDYYVSYLIVEAATINGAPTVEVGAQTFDDANKLWYMDVTCTPNEMTEEGSTEKLKTVVYYTTDGTAPSLTNGTLYTEPIRCYQNTSIKFQPYMDLGFGDISEDDIVAGADVQANATFSFNAPTITTDGATFAIASEYAEQNGINYYTLNGGEAKQGDGETLELGNSAIVEAYTKISNGKYGEFISNSASTPVYAMKAIKENKSVTVSGSAVEQTAEDGTKSYVLSDDAAVNADKEYFFLNSPSMTLLPTADDTKSIYQAPVGQEVYMQMNKNTVSFLVAAGDSVTVTVTCSKNSCKTLDSDDESKIDRKCYVNVNGTNYGNEDITAENGNIITFGLKAGEAADEAFTFMKWKNTGNILVSSIAIAYYGPTTGIENIATVAEKAQNGAIYNLAGQKVSNSFKGIVIQNGKKFVK